MTEDTQNNDKPESKQKVARTQPQKQAQTQSLPESQEKSQTDSNVKKPPEQKKLEKRLASEDSVKDPYEYNQQRIKLKKKPSTQQETSTHIQNQEALKDENSEASSNSNRSHFIKIGAIAIFCVFFLIGLTFISGLVKERQHYHNQAITQIKKVHSPDQQVITPFILLERPQITCADLAGRMCRTHSAKVLTPIKSNWSHNAKVTNQDHHIGIYKAISFQDQLTIDATYQINPSMIKSWFEHADKQQTDYQEKSSTNPQKIKDDYAREGIDISNVNTTPFKVASVYTEGEALAKIETATETVADATKDSSDFADAISSDSHATAKLIISLTDINGFLELPTVTIQGKKYTFDYPKEQRYFGLNYLEIELPKKLLQTASSHSSKQLKMQFNLKFKGIDSISSLPLGKNSTVKMTSNWQDHKMIGITTENKDFANNTFSANWFSPFQSIANTQKLNQCIASNHLKICHFLGTKDQSYGVKFIQATNAYSLSDRTIKYALLLLLIIFGAFFLFEVTQEILIHPIQYALVGAALLVFYVLVLSLSEQIEFAMAYLIAAVGCVALISWYVFYVLQSMGRAIMLGGILSTLYASFYFIIQTKDNNLIIGSVFMFAMIALAMFFTRHIDWYKQA